MKTRKVSVGGKPFSARNPLPIGAIGLVMIIALLWAAFNASSLPIIGSGTTYTAYFTEDANLRPDDVVLVAGVKVGTVETTDLDGSRVKVTFKIKNAFIGNESTLADQAEDAARRRSTSRSTRSARSPRTRTTRSR